MENLLIFNSILLWVALIINFILTLALVRRLNATTNQADPAAQDHIETMMLQVGEKAPDFTARTLDGKWVKHSDYGNSEIAIVFVTPGCDPCVEEMPYLEELMPHAKQVGVELVVVSLGDSKETRDLVELANFNTPILVAPVGGSNTFATDYKVKGTPSYYLIDSTRIVRAAGVFDPTWRELTKNWMSSTKEKLATT